MVIADIADEPLYSGKPVQIAMAAGMEMRNPIPIRIALCIRSPSAELPAVSDGRRTNSTQPITAYTAARKHVYRTEGA